MPEYPDDFVSEMGDALHGYYLDFEPDPKVLKKVLDDHPGLAAEAEFWGWTDTETRGWAIDAFARSMGQQWPRYGATVADLAGLESALKSAHDQILGS